MSKNFVTFLHFGCLISDEIKGYQCPQGKVVNQVYEKTDISEEVLCAEYEAVYHYVWMLCGNAADAQDITQEAFLHAMKRLDQFAGKSSLYTWLCAIAKHIWLNQCKKRKKEILPEYVEEICGDERISLEQQIADKDAAMEIHRALHTLQEPYKEVFSLRVFGELSFGEIAGLFQKSESWARVTYHRAKKMICDMQKIRKDG